jgi:membrane-associated protease RseP (regulator of RpoE activity)
MQSLIYPAAFIVVLGILVFVHEFGHYAVAKLFKVRVEVFSLGFGKRLIGFRRGDTDYRISLLPLGGYVKMAGENPMEARTGDPGEFMSHPRWQRFLIAIAGPAMNIVLAIALLTGVYMVHGNEYPAFKDEPSVIGWVFEGSPAAQAGIVPGDKILRIDNVDNPTWEQTLIRAVMNPGQKLELVIQRGGEVLRKTVSIPQPTGRDQSVDVGWMPSGPAVVGEVEMPPRLTPCCKNPKTSQSRLRCRGMDSSSSSPFSLFTMKRESDSGSAYRFRNPCTWRSWRSTRPCARPDWSARTNPG